MINTINRFEPRVRLQNVITKAIFQSNSFHVTVTYRIVGIPITETIEFVLQRPE